MIMYLRPGSYGVLTTFFLFVATFSPVAGQTIPAGSSESGRGIPQDWRVPDSGRISGADVFELLTGVFNAVNGNDSGDETGLYSLPRLPFDDDYILGKNEWGSRRFALDSAMNPSDSRRTPSEEPNMSVALSLLNGTASRSDIEAFQEAEGLEVDGIAGPRTMQRLIDRLQGRAGSLMSRSQNKPPPSGPQCERGQVRINGACTTFDIPENGQLTESGRDWFCAAGFRAERGACLEIVLPANARLNETGSNWECAPSFRYLAGRCQPIRIPANATINSVGTDWVCNSGFRRVGNRCTIN